MIPREYFTVYSERKHLITYSLIRQHLQEMSIHGCIYTSFAKTYQGVTRDKWVNLFIPGYSMKLSLRIEYY